MDTSKLNVAQAKLVFVVQSTYGFGKGLSLKQARNNYKLHNSSSPAPTHCSIFIIADELTEEEAYSEITIDTWYMTHETDKVMLLQTTEL